MEITCRICGAKEQSTRWETKTRAILEEEQLCFTCCFWTSLIATVDDQTAVIDGVVYRIGPKLPPKTPSHCKGFSGHKFTIRFNDGRRIETDNLWHGSTVPERFKLQLPDNAAFEKR